MTDVDARREHGIYRAREMALLVLVLLGAAAFKVSLLALDAVPFNADEAVVALMARHILQGERPWFFYGQAYMGSLDAYLIAGAFRLFGQHVRVIRWVQIALFLLTLATGYRVAQRFSPDRRAPLLTLVLMAFPPVLMTLYTSATLGGYGEMLLIGNLLLWWGHRLGYEDARNWTLWVAWGLVAGVGFWAFGLVLVYLLPAALWLIWRLRARVWRGAALAILAFFVGSVPWCLGNVGQLTVGLAELLGTAVSSTATATTLLGNVGMRVFSFLVFGLPVLFGLRFPWSVQGSPLWLGVPALTLYLGALGWGLHRRATATARMREGRWLLWGVWGALFLGFVLTPFGGDPSGRYFTPLYLPLCIFSAEVLGLLRQRFGRWAWLALGAVLLFNGVGTVQAALTNPPGITTQFDAITQVDRRYDEALIEFLQAHGGTRGYTNYWVAYPIAFLSNEEIILIPRLPYKADFRYTSRDDRYPPYQEWVAQSADVVYVTTNHPRLDGLLRQRFAALGVSVREKQIGDYHIFYDLSRRVAPDELDLPFE